MKRTLTQIKEILRSNKKFTMIVGEKRVPKSTVKFTIDELKILDIVVSDYINSDDFAQLHMNKNQIESYENAEKKIRNALFRVYEKAITGKL